MAQAMGDQERLRIAGEVARQVGIKKFHPQDLVWRNKIPPDQCFFIGRHFKHIVLSEFMAGRLTPEEWKPLLASSLLLNKIPGGRRLAASTVAVSVLLLAGLFIASLIFPPLWVQVLGPAIGIPLEVFILLRAFRWLRQGFLWADATAAKLLGRTLSEVLAKIEAAQGLSHTERLTKRARLAAFRRPNASERLENLARVSQT